MNATFDMPIQETYQGRRFFYRFEPTALRRQQAELNHCGQTIKRLRDRHGMAWSEMAAIVECRPCRLMNEKDSFEALRACGEIIEIK